MSKVMMNKLKGCIFYTEDDKLLDTSNNIWNKVCNSIKNNFVSNPSIRKNF